MRRNRIGWILCVLLFCAMIAPIIDAAPREVFLGSRFVDFKVDHDEIAVGKYRGQFRKLRFQVKGNDVEIFDLFVVYANNDKDKIPVKLIFNEGNRSRIIDLEGRHRFIRKIIFNYRSIGPVREGKAEIRVYGIR